MINEGANLENNLPLIQPMEPILIESIPEDVDCLAQVKWDGIRLLAYIHNGDVQLYTRNRHPRTWTYPEIVMDLQAQFPDQQLILDGECVSIKEGKPNFFQILKRDRLKDLKKIQHMMSESPVTYQVFDLLYLNGKWLTQHPLEARMERLRSLLITTPFVQLCLGVEDEKRLLTYVEKKQWEGIVLKEKRSVYRFGEKHSSWMKFKLRQRIKAFVVGVTFRSRRVKSLILGWYEEDSWHYIGKVSSGLTQKEIELITNWVASIQVDQPPMIQVPREKEPIVWVPPHLKVEVEFMEWTPSGTLRSPVIKGYSFQK